MKTLLSLDGGGLRSIIQTTILDRIEKEILHGSAFGPDFLVGTSGGGIVALGLAAGLSPAELTNLWRTEATTIFHTCGLGTAIFSPKYASNGLESVLRQTFGQRTLGMASRPTAVVSFNLESQLPSILASYADAGWTFVDAALATSAGPTYFPAFGSYVDGGLVANNPSNVAIAQAVGHFGWGLADIRLLSLGTGWYEPIQVQLESAGELQWASNISQETIDGVSTLNHILAAQLLGPDYLRIDPMLTKAEAPMDNADPKNLDALVTLANKAFDDNRAALENFFKI